MIEIKCTKKQQDELIELMKGDACNCGILIGKSCNGECGRCLERNIKWDIQPKPLKPCPLCGGEGELIDTVLGASRIICKNCGIETQNYIDKCNLIEYWNRRVDK